MRQVHLTEAEEIIKHIKKLITRKNELSKEMLLNLLSKLENDFIKGNSTDRLIKNVSEITTAKILSNAPTKGCKKAPTLPLKMLAPEFVTFGGHCNTTKGADEQTRTFRFAIPVGYGYYDYGLSNINAGGKLGVNHGHEVRYDRKNVYVTLWRKGGGLFRTAWLEFNILIRPKLSDFSVCKKNIANNPLISNNS